MNATAMPSSAIETPSRPSDPSAVSREEWMHDFRNALGNIVIAASAASSQAGEATDPLLRTAIAEIESGCQRCMKLLRAMPK